MRVIFGFVWVLVFYGGLLFVPAGTLRWGRAWVFIGVLLCTYAFLVLTVFNRNPGLLKERYGVTRGDQPRSDRILLGTFVMSYCVQVWLIPMDVFRWRLLPPPSDAASVFGLGLVLLCYAMFYLTFRENSFASPVVRHQEERAHRLVDSGVYSVVRHPMYAGALGLMLGTPLWLQSTLATCFALVPIGLLMLRIGLEERFLREHLPGYPEYAARVRYRLLPGLW